MYVITFSEVYRSAVVNSRTQTNKCLFLCSLAEVRAEYDDFQESSRELEAELEAQLEQAEATTKDLRSHVQRLEEDNESLKVRV